MMASLKDNSIYDEKMIDAEIEALDLREHYAYARVLKLIK